MKQWLNDPKNQPIVYGIAALVVIVSIGAVLFSLRVFNPPAPYVPKLAGMPTPMTGVGPNGPIPAGESTGPVPNAPAMPGAMTRPSTFPMRPAGPGKHMASNAGVPSSTFAGGVDSAAAPAVVAAAPNARVDPFAPYGGVIRLQRPPRPPVASFVPDLIFSKITPAGQTNEESLPTDQVTPSAAPPITVNGVMLGNGAYALVDNGGQSLVLQPGDQIPNGGGQVVSIQSDSISVKEPGGQTVKVPVTSGQSAGNQGAPGGQYPGQYGGNTQYPGQYGNQGGGQYNGQMPPRAPIAPYPGG